MEENIAIAVHDIRKQFILPQYRSSSIKQAVINLTRRNSKVRQDVLKGISFEIKKGEFFGIVGRNGGGKSTLLKILAGVYTPTSGGVVLNGRLTPFIELGVGFNPELSGRDNVFLNSALLGFTHKQTEAMYDRIVEFAELEPYMGQKLKNYSSGMQVRLAFSIAIQANSDILLIDEVLAVGDSNFQKKCFAVFEKFKEEGRTVVFVSHSMDMVVKFCDRAILINKGKIKAQGDPEVVAAEYEMMNVQRKDKDVDTPEIRTPREAHIVSSVVEQFTPGDSLLELGSADGRHVALLNAAGLNAQGIEKNQSARMNSIKEYKIQVSEDLKSVEASKEITGLLLLDNKKGTDRKYIDSVFKELDGGRLDRVRKVYLHLPFHLYQKYRSSKDSALVAHLGEPIDVQELASVLRTQGFIQVSGGLYGADESYQYAEGAFERIDDQRKRALWESLAD